MIESVHIENVATYKSGIDFSPKKINFIYGANGSGKSTISKVIGGELGSSKSKIIWEDGRREEVLVYNRSFVKKNFDVAPELAGIFTLGEDSIEAQKTIILKSKERDEAEREKEDFQVSIKKIDDELCKLRKEIELKCWNVQKKYGSEFSEALTGYRNNANKFCDLCISHIPSDNDEISKYDELKEVYQISFSKDITSEKMYNQIPMKKIVELDTNELMEEAIVGKSDSPIGTFIEYLKSSDWVKIGIEYSKKVPGKCPYCQRELSDSVQQEIEDYFDENYKSKKSKLITYLNDYKNVFEELSQVIQEIDERQIGFLDYTDFKVKKDLLIVMLQKNIQSIQNKVEMPSELFQLESVVSLAESIKKIISGYNEKIEQNNELIAHKEDTKEKCRQEVRKYLAFQCKQEILDYLKQNSGKEKGKAAILQRKISKEKIIDVLNKEITEKEMMLTTVRPTVRAINDILEGFGFLGFSLDENDEQLGTYKIVRPSGEDASKTLSEGEYNFISFLYFYHLCFGSQTKTGITNNKVLIIDDPISSMDSNVLFIVSTLVKNMLRNCKDGEQGIKQILILTHNVYFHKEITFWGNKDALPTTETRYYVLRKKEENTSIEEYEKNPICTSYELLWKELKNDNISSTNTILNVMRRILEHYFTVVGGINYEACVNHFNGTDKIICKALIAFINDGSHSVFEDLIFTPEDGSIESYQRVFKLVFEKLGHIDHYTMMMEKA